MPSQPGKLRPLIVTIDGPAGAGKTSVSRMLARRLGYRYIDTGALYRTVAVAVRDAGIDSDDDVALEALCKEIRIDLKREDNRLQLLLDGRDVADHLRSPDITMLASAISARPVVREFLLGIQRKLGGAGEAVLEGRDMGTVVFPQADVKFFLVADPGIRAQRRFAELQAESGQGPSLKAVEKDMRKRDKDDSSRQLAPLKPAPDAIQIDSTAMSIDDVVALMLEHIAKASESR